MWFTQRHTLLEECMLLVEHFRSGSSKGRLLGARLARILLPMGLSTWRVTARPSHGVILQRPRLPRRNIPCGHCYTHCKSESVAELSQPKHAPGLSLRCSSIHMDITAWLAGAQEIHSPACRSVTRHVDKPYDLPISDSLSEVDAWMGTHYR